jgi:hypothetical protein
MILSSKLLEYLFQMPTGENRVGSKQREREGEKQINRVREGALGKFKEQCGLEAAVREKDTLVFQKDQMNRTKTTAIKWDINDLGWVSNSLCSVL